MSNVLPSIAEKEQVGTTMIIKSPHLCTTLDIWQPKYGTQSGGWEVWLSKFKIRYASPVIIIKFTKAKHLIGQRFAVRRQDVEQSPVGTNGKIQVYRVPFEKLEPYETPADIRNVVEEIFTQGELL